MPAPRPAALLLAPAVLLAQAPVPPADADRAAITAAALDYMEGWYEGNADRMERALHPELAKRILNVDDKGRGKLDHMGALTLILGTRAGFGKRTPAARQQKDVQIFDVYGNTATAKATMADWIDYLHLVKANGQWKIVNVLWERKPGPAKP
jgi:hypothetical protein